MAAGKVAEGAGDRTRGLVPALSDLDRAVRTLQLYPPSSPVVGRAVERARESLSPYLTGERLSLAVLPDSLRIDETDAAWGNATVRTLAERLHQRGVAHLHLDAGLQSESLQCFAEILATDPDTLNQQGGVGALCERRQLAGINVDMLQLDKLFTDRDKGDPDPDATVWEKILGSYRHDVDIESIDWQALAADAEQFGDFLGWLLDDESPPPAISEMSRLQITRTVCQRVGEAAAALGPEQVEAVAGVVGRFYNQLDKEIWIDLLGEPFGLADGNPAANADPPDGEECRIRSAATTLGGVDLGNRIGAALDRRQVEDLLVYALTSRREASPRIFRLFRSLLEARSERDLMEQAIREAVERQTRTDAERQSFRDLWPRLSEALQGENIDPYVSTTYRAQMEQLLVDAPLAPLWDLDRIQPRLRELEPSYLMQRKVKVILEVLAAESDDADYRTLVGELERSLPELIVGGQYITADEILSALSGDLDPARGRSDAQREAACDVLIRFCNEHTLRAVVRNLAGKQSTQIDAAARIFSSLGPMAVPALLEALSNEQSRPVRVHLVRMLAAIGDQALPEIRKHLRDKRWFFVRNLVWIIGEIGDPRFVPHLGIIVNHPDVRVRRETVRSIAKLQNDTAAEALLSAVDDADPSVRLLAIRGLGTSRSRSGVARLRQLITLANTTGKNTEIIRAAAIALGRIGAREALADLEELSGRPWLFRGRRIAASEAARWAVATLQGESTGEPPEARTRPPGRDDDAHPDNVAAL
ncbi:MAG: HEAT repeat domain-containing protein [Acidobacteriota bacterium]